MKFFEWPMFVGDDIGRVLSYLKETINPGVRDLMTGLRSIDFKSNFKVFEYTGTIASGTTVTIANPFKAAPTYRILTKVRPLAAGTCIIDDGLTAWDGDRVFLRNSGTASAEVKALFFE